MWHKIVTNDIIIRNCRQGDYLRFIGDSGDLIGDIQFTYIIIGKYGDVIEYADLKFANVKTDDIQRFERGNWYIKSGAEPLDL